MVKSGGSAKALEAWLGVPGRIEKALEGLGEDALDWRGGEEGWSIRETAHHLVEANLVASNIVIAALATNGGTYDWSWIHPDATWMKRAGYTTAPIQPAIDALRALGRHIGGLIMAAPDGFTREVRLLDAPKAKPYTKSVLDLLWQEVEHSEEHLRGVMQTRETRPTRTKSHRRRGATAAAGKRAPSRRVRG